MGRNGNWSSRRGYWLKNSDLSWGSGDVIQCVHRKIILAESGKWFGRQRWPILGTHYMFVEEMNVTQQLLCPVYVLVLLGSGELVVDKTDTLNGLIMIIHLKDDETWTLGGSSGRGRKGWICGIL